MPTNYKIVKEKREMMRMEEPVGICEHCNKEKPAKDFSLLPKTFYRNTICKVCSRLSGTVNRLRAVLDESDVARYKITGDYVYINDKRFLKNFVVKYYGLNDDVGPEDLELFWRSLIILLMP